MPFSLGHLLKLSYVQNLFQQSFQLDSEQT